MKLFLIFVFLFMTIFSFAQAIDVEDCSDANYSRINDEANDLFAKKQLAAAESKYRSLLACRSDSVLYVESKLRMIRDALRIQNHESKVSTARFLITEASTAFKNEDIRLAWRLMEAALGFDPSNIDALKMRDTLPYFSAKIVLNADFLVFVSPDSSFLAYTTETKSGKADLYLLDLRGNNTAKKIGEPFIDIGSNYLDLNTSDIIFSPDSRYLIFTVFDEGGTESLNIYNIYEDTINKNITNCDCEINSSKFLFSPNGLFLALTIDFPLGGDSLYSIDLSQGHLINKSPISSSFYYSIPVFSPDSRFLTFVSDVGEERAIINILNIKERINKIKISFNKPKEGGVITDKSYSYNSQYLLYIEAGENNKNVLNLVDLYSESVPYKFIDIFTQDGKFQFSPDSRFLTIITINSKGKQVLKVFELNNGLPPKKYKNIYFGLDGKFVYSPDGKFLCILKDPKAKYYNTVALSILNLKQKSLYIKNVNIFYMKKKGVLFSPDSRFIAYVTEDRNESRTLHVLSMNDKGYSKSYENAKFNNDKFDEMYSPDSRFLTFFSGDKDGCLVLKILDLNFIEEPKAYKNVISLGDVNDFFYSKNSRTLVFLTEDTIEGKVLNVLKLESTLGMAKKFRCAGINTFYYRDEMISDDSRYVSFDIISESGKHTFNLYDLKQDTLQIFDVDSYVSFNKGFDNENHYFAYKVAGNNEIVLFDLHKNEVVRKISHQFNVSDDNYRFISNKHFLTISENPYTRTHIYKILYLPLGKDYFNHYSEKEFSKLSLEEKKEYKID